MRTEDAGPARAPLYARMLRLRHVRVGGFASFALFECMIALGVLLALAELVSWWAVPVLPAAVAGMVKVNDLVVGSARQSTAQRGTTGARTRASARSTAAGARATGGGAGAVRAAAGTAGDGTADPRRASRDDDYDRDSAGGVGRAAAPAVGRVRVGAPQSDERPPVGAIRIAASARGVVPARDAVPARDGTPTRDTVPLRDAVPMRDGVPTGRRSAARHAQSGQFEDEAYSRIDGQRSLRDDDTLRTRNTLNQGRFA